MRSTSGATGSWHSRQRSDTSVAAVSVRVSSHPAVGHGTTKCSRSPAPRRVGGAMSAALGGSALGRMLGAVGLWKRTVRRSAGPRGCMR